jgi:hypothetical protein
VWIVSAWPKGLGAEHRDVGLEYISRPVVQNSHGMPHDQISPGGQKEKNTDHEIKGVGQAQEGDLSKHVRYQ